ncbi:MAG: hypothetical protein C4K58_04455 [Flavobacteriaceae bacterium]|nr:MAG: hypothetical protein C4K58_04455 [Flavobacteriaceae bacterium]
MLNAANENTGLPTQMSMDWVFEHVANKKLIFQGGEKTKLANAMIKNKNKVERFVFAIDKTDGSGYFTKLSNEFKN